MADVKENKDIIKRVREKYRELTNILIKKGITISTMESITSGLVASLITDTEGASAVLKEAFITYSNEAKIREGVSAGVIRKYSVYSEQTAASMARACQTKTASDICIGITGTAGNADPSNEDASVPGTVYFCIYFYDSTDNRYHYAPERIMVPPQPTRLMYKIIVAEHVCDALMATIDRM